MMLFVGCEPKATEQVVRPTNPNPVDAPSAKPLEPALAEISAAEELNQNALPTVAPKAEALTPAISTADKPTVKPVSTPALKKPVAAPTSEQLAAWSWPEHEPLQLLAAKESNKIGLVTCAARTNDGRYYILAGFKVTLWSVGGTEPEHVFLELADPNKENYVRSMAVSPDGMLLAVGDSEGTVTIWNIADRTELVSKKVDTNDIVDLAFSPDSQSIATISFDSEVFIWSTGKLEPKSKFKFTTNTVRNIGFVDNDKLLALGEKASIWNIADGKLAKDLPGNATIKCWLTRTIAGRFFSAVNRRCVDGASLRLNRSHTLKVALPTTKWLSFRRMKRASRQPMEIRFDCGMWRVSNAFR